MEMVTVYKNTNTAGESFEVGFDVIYERISNGNKGLKEKTNKIRENVTIGNDKMVRTLKESLPMMRPSGLFNGTGTSDDLVKHSSVVSLDIDNAADVGSVQAILAEFPKTFLSYISPSGTGVKPLFRVNPAPTNAEEQEHAIKAIATLLRDELGITDPIENCTDITRNAFLAYDPQAIWNPDAEPIDVEMLEADDNVLVNPQRGNGYATLATSPKSDYLLETIQIGTQDYGTHIIDGTSQSLNILNYIPAVTYPIWLRVGFVLYRLGVNFEVWDTWSKQMDYTRTKYNQATCRKFWDSNSFSNTDREFQPTWQGLIRDAKLNMEIDVSDLQPTFAFDRDLDAVNEFLTKAEITDAKAVKTAQQVIIVIPDKALLLASEYVATLYQLNSPYEYFEDTNLYTSNLTKLNNIIHNAVGVGKPYQRISRFNKVREAIRGNTDE